MVAGNGDHTDLRVDPHSHDRQLSPAIPRGALYRLARAGVPRYLARSLVDILFWIAVVCCVIAQVAIARSTLGARARSVVPRPGVPRPRRSIEIAWTVLPAVGLALALFMTWRAIHAPAVPDRPPVVFERVSSN